MNLSGKRTGHRKIGWQRSAKCDVLLFGELIIYQLFIFYSAKSRGEGEKKNVRIGATSQQCVMGAGIAALVMRYGNLVHISPEVYSGEKIWRSLQISLRAYEI